MNMTDENKGNDRSVPITASDRKSNNDDVKDTPSIIVNKETLSVIPQRLSVGPDIESEKSPFIRSISPFDIPLDSARHVITDTNHSRDSGVHECEDCGMAFSRMWLLEFHQNRLCCGNVSQDDVERIKSVQNENRNRQSTPIDSGKDEIRNRILNKDDKKLRWIACSDGNVAQFAVKVGYDTIYKCNLYVCRANVDNEKVPGQVVPSHNCAFVTVNGQEVRVTDYDVLTDSQQRLSWKPCNVKGAMPRGTQAGGYDANKLMYFIARGRTPDGNHCSGKYIPQEQKCFFAWKGQEMSSENFDFLCKK